MASHQAALESIRDMVSTFMERDDIQSGLSQSRTQSLLGGGKRRRAPLNDGSFSTSFEHRRATEASQDQVRCFIPTDRQ